MTDLIKYGDSWEKIVDNVIEFYAIMIACAEYPIGLRNYSSIDEIIQADDFEETIKDYRELAKQIINFNYKQYEEMKDVLEENELLKKSIKRQQLSNEECSKYIEKLVKENEQLKKEVENLKDINARCCNEYSYFHKRMMKLEKENGDVE